MSALPLHAPAPSPGGRQGLDRRTFLQVVSMAAASVGLTGSAAARVLEAATRGLKPSVIWLHFQECTGCEGCTRSTPAWPAPCTRWTSRAGRSRG